MSRMEEQYANMVSEYVSAFESEVQYDIENDIEISHDNAKDYTADIIEALEDDDIWIIMCAFNRVNDVVDFDISYVMQDSIDSFRAELTEALKSIVDEYVDL